MPSIGSYLQPNNNDNIVLKGYAHASRLYADGVFALAPKTGWIHYVVFDINPDAVVDKTWLNQQKITEVGMLVKSSDLPKFQISTEVVNQYNRKTVIQKNISYQTVNMTLHDDHSNVTHNMWLNYFRYYFVDSTLGGTGPAGTAKDKSTGAFSNNKYELSTNLYSSTNYGLNSELVKNPFFRSITIYQLNKQIFTSYQLINPIVRSWEHDRVDQTQGNKIAESKMSVEYETVFYGTGRVAKDNPTGFAIFHYDTRPSPLGSNNIAGILGDITNQILPNASPGALDSLSAALAKNTTLNNIAGIATNLLNPSKYSILGKVERALGTGGFNGLGVNLNINKGNNYATAGQTNASPVSLVTGSTTGQEADINGVLTQATIPDGVIPTSANPATSGYADLQQITETKKIISDAQFSASTSDTTPAGTTIALGNYFPPVPPLSDSSPYTASSNITNNNSYSEISQAYSTLNTSWSTDNDFVNSQTLTSDQIINKLNTASSPEEFAAIQQAATDNLSIAQNLQETVNNKYMPEATRLNSLLTTAQNDVSASGNLSSTPDLSSSNPITEI